MLQRYAHGPCPHFQQFRAVLTDLCISHDYRSDRSNLVEEFYVPCLTESTAYWRAVGYFTTHGLALAGKGISSFIHNGGTMRLVASPWLELDDIEAIKQGYEARQRVLETSAERQLADEAIASLPDISLHRLECIAWLVGEGRLDIKLAMPAASLLGHGRGIYHEKVGIFFDQNHNAVAFSGSSNETVGGLIGNFESFDVHLSWDDPHGRVTRKTEDFKRLWSNQTRDLVVLDFPESAKRNLLRLRPSKPPNGDPEISRVYPSASISPNAPDLPAGVELRSYQLDACDAWLEQDGRGILAMATGSGKTFTSLAAAARLLKERTQLLVVIACPFQHLVDQWCEAADEFGFRPMKGYQSRESWERTVNSRILDYNLGNRNIVMVVTTHATLSGDTMQATLARVGGSALLIADEVHYLGAEFSRGVLPLNFQYRMGLSATPNRWFDEEGTRYLQAYFGGTVFEFDLADAIGQGFLTEYEYHPHLVDLDAEEIDAYVELTQRIARVVHGGGDYAETELYRSLLRRRADILNNARNKIDKLRDLLEGQAGLDHALFYCAPGQIEAVLSLLGNEFGFRVHKFTAEEPTAERARLLADFDSGRLQALVAMRCLDEGVDVPSTRVAYILASSSNPREFVQRRGRILRRSPGKDRAVIHDLIALPDLPSEGPSGILAVERGILRRELTRFREFADNSVNRFRATDLIWEYARSYGLLDY